METQVNTIPKSATRFYIGFVGVIVYFITIYYLKIYSIDSFWGAIISMFAVSASMIILEKFHLKKEHLISSGIDFSTGNKIDIKRVVIKLIGLYGTIGLAATFYWVFHEYRSDFYSNYFRLAKILLPIILVGAIPYFILLDKYMKEPRDSYWHAGNAFLFRWVSVDKTILKHHILGWLVKVFFFALMFTYLVNNTGFLLTNSFSESKSNFPSFFDYTYNLLYSIDLLFVSAGYLLTLQILDSHIRTTEPTIFGWIVALQCYEPFWGLMSYKYLSYDDNFTWVNLVASNYSLYKLWGLVILFLVLIYVLSTIVFGVRFSNLTNRGIITNGPYRFMKHPAYISKNISWWLISIPFISSDGSGMALKHCLLLLILNVIYYFRAKTEERHLSLDPVYVKYATEMNEKGIFKGLYKIFPFLKYDVNKYIENGELKKLYF